MNFPFPTCLLLSSLPSSAPGFNRVQMDPQLLKGIDKCQTSCKTAVAALNRSTKRNEAIVPPGLNEIFAQLLHNLRQSVTSLGLAFKPPITIPAALDQLDKISDQIGRLISCVLITMDGEAELLAAEWRGGVVEIEWEVEKQLSTLKEGGDYLAHTGMIWEAIDRLTKDLPRDEKSAAARRLTAQLSLIKDAWEEFKEILESEGEEADDGWDELGLEGSLSEVERARAEGAKPLLALYLILFATVPKHLGDVREYVSLVEASTQFVNTFDDAVSAMHPGQDEQDIEDTMEELEEVANKVVALIGGTHFARWKDRLVVEKSKWEERRLDLGSLVKAIE